MMELLGVFTAALAAENLFFARAFDTYAMRQLHKEPKKILLYGLLMTAFLAVAGPLTYGISKLLFGTALYTYLNAIAHLLVLILLFCTVYFLLQKYVPKVFEQIGKYLPYAAINCGTLGSLLLVAKDADINSLGKAWFYHLGASVGYTLAMLLLCSIRQRLSSCNASKSFRGLPLEMITAGLIALALVGLSGYQLPA